MQNVTQNLKFQASNLTYIAQPVSKTKTFVDFSKDEIDLKRPEICSKQIYLSLIKTRLLQRNYFKKLFHHTS